MLDDGIHPSDTDDGALLYSFTAKLFPISMLIQAYTKIPQPKGCDTFIAYPPLTPDGLVVFGKNSDRPSGEGQSITRYPSQSYPPDSMLECTYISIPQVSRTHAVLLSQIDWMWGCENGANEHGVVIGNEAVWTKVPEETEIERSDDGVIYSSPSQLLLGMDLVRLGNERGKSSREAMDVITSLLEEHGQGGPCAKNDPSFTYHNSFLIADYDEAWILETAGRHWVAQRLTEGGRNISNGLTIRTDFDLSSDGIREYAKDNGWWNGSDGDEFDFAAVFSEGGVDESPNSRQHCGKVMLAKHDSTKSFGKDDMIAILRDHESGICMHGAFETTASMISELYPNKEATHWMTGKSFPCRCKFILQEIE